MRLGKSFNIVNTVAILLGILAVSAILGAYYFIYQATSNTTYENNIKRLNTLQELDKKWSVCILETRSYTLQDFDQLAFYMIKIRETLNLLDKEGMLDKERVGGKTVNQYQIYKYSFETKNEAVEHYKSQQAILRNAVRYLPTISKELQQVFAKKQLSKNTNVHDLVMATNVLIRQFLLSSSEEDADATRKKLTLLYQQTAKESEEVFDVVRNYLTHTRLILKHNPKVKQMLETAMSTNIGELSANVVREYTKSQQVIKHYIRGLQQIMLAGGIVLLLLILLFLHRLRHSNVKAIVANTKSKKTQQQLLQAKAHIGQVNKNILQAERRAASGELAIGTFKQLETIMLAFDQDIAFLSSIEADEILLPYKNKLQGVINNINQLQDGLNELNVLIKPQQPHHTQTPFDFNKIIKKALDTASFEAEKGVTFTHQLSDIPFIQANPIDVFQIALKLFRQATQLSQTGDDNIFIKTWATEHHANIYITPPIGSYDLATQYEEEKFAVIREMLAQNQGQLKFTPRGQNENGVFWVSFPY